MPSRDHDHCDKKSADEALRLFKKELPALALLCTDQYISPDTPYSVDEDVKLVCKYLRALKTGGTNGIDRLRTDQDGSIVKFSKDSITEEECHKLLVKYMPEHITKSKITQRLFIKLVHYVNMLYFYETMFSVTYVGTCRDVVVFWITYNILTSTKE